MNRKRPPLWFFLIMALLALAGLRLCYDRLKPEQLLDRADPLFAGYYLCLRITEPPGLVVRGADSLTRNGKSFPIRLAGIRPNPENTAEHSLAAMLAELIGPGQRIRLEFDRERFDRERIPLAYVFLDNRLINAELVAAGWAIPDPLPGSSSPWQKTIRNAAANELPAERP